MLATIAKAFGILYVVIHDEGPLSDKPAAAFDGVVLLKVRKMSVRTE